MPVVSTHAARLWRWLTSLPWWLPIILATILALDACSRPNDPPVAASDFGLWLFGPHMFGGSRHPRPYPLVIVRGPDGIERFDLQPFSGEPFEGEVVLRSWVLPASTRYHGVWGMTSRTLSILDSSEVAAADPSERRRWLGLLDDHLAETGLEPSHPLRVGARMLRDGVMKRTEPVATGYIHNTLAITLALAFLWSCTLGRPWRSWAAVRRDYHLAHARCPACRYPVHGYPGTVCPECGMDWGDQPGAS